MSFFILIASTISIIANGDKVITIEALTAGDGQTGYITGSQYLAFQSINNRTDILQNYKLNLRWHNTNNDPSRAICQAICIANPTDTCHPTKDCNTTKVPNTNNQFTIPIMFGHPTSSLSATIAPILSAFDWAQISSSATSSELSEPKFSAFYRTVPSDDIQAKAIIWLCYKYNWSRIAVVYPADRYGAYLSNNIHEIAAKENIKVSSISYYAALIDSIESAAAAIKRSENFIIVLITGASSYSLALLFDIFERRGLLQFPYYYIGTDAWFQTERIQSAQIQKYTKGFIGTVPWQPTALHHEIYKSVGLGEMHNASMSQYEELVMRWEDALAHNEHFQELVENLRVNTDYLGAFSIYGWDTAHAIAYALEEYDRVYNLSNITNESTKNVSRRLRSILKESSFEFIGSTGYVAFDDDGNRLNALYTIGNVIDSNGSIEYFAVWDDSYNTSEADIDDTDESDCNNCTQDIIWPDAFVERDMQPRSEKLITYEVVSCNVTVEVVFTVLCILSICIVLFAIYLQWRWRKNKILMAASWKLNILTCTGCIMSHFVIIMYSWPSTTALCNIREWFLAISFTLVFMPLFMKTYRLSVLFTGMLKVRTMSDYKLVIGVLICLLLDCIIMSVFTAIEIDDIELVNGPKYSVHELWDVQQLYVYCNKDGKHFGGGHGTDKVFVVVIASWKAIQLLYGLCVALVDSRISLE